LISTSFIFREGDALIFKLILDPVIQEFEKSKVLPEVFRELVRVLCKVVCHHDPNGEFHSFAVHALALLAECLRVRTYSRPGHRFFTPLAQELCRLLSNNFVTAAKGDIGRALDWVLALRPAWIPTVILYHWFELIDPRTTPDHTVGYRAVSELLIYIYIFHKNQFRFTFLCNVWTTIFSESCAYCSQVYSSQEVFFSPG
jgi:hypothetical protein